MLRTYILLLTATLFIHSCDTTETREQNVSDLIHLAGQKHGSGEYEESVELLTQAIKLDPKNILAYINRAASKTKLKRIDDAILDCKKVVELDPKNMLAHFNLAQHYETKKDYEKAIEHYTHAETANLSAPKIRLIVTNPDGTSNEGPDYSIAIGDISYYRAMAYMKSFKYNEAIIDFNFCVSIDYYLDYCFCRLGECHQKLHNQKEACAYFMLSKENGVVEADSLYNKYCK